MKFYNRENELRILNEMALKAQKKAQMTFIIGRRRIGKTKLILQCYQNQLVYLFVSKKSEPMLCSEFIDQIQTSLNITIHGEFRQFSKLFEYLLSISCTQSFTLAIDEFQTFLMINPSILIHIRLN